MKNVIILFLSLFILYSCKQKTAEEYYEIGNSKFKIANYEEAIVYFTKAIQSNPKYAEAYYMRANASISNNHNHRDRDSTFADLSKAIKLNPKYIDAYKVRASLKIENGPNVAAFEDYNKLIELSTNKDEYYSLRANLKYKLYDFKSAIEDSKKALTINPKEVRYYLNIGHIYGTNFHNPLFNKKEELANYEKAYLIDTTNAFILIYIADTKTILKDHKGAVVYYTKYLESKFNDEKSYKKTDIIIARGKAKILAGMIESGLADFSKAGELGNKEAYTAIAEYEGEKGRIEFERNKAKSGLGITDFYMGQSTENWLGKH